jgi:hypothetical protein
VFIYITIRITLYSKISIIDLWNSIGPAEPGAPWRPQSRPTHRNNSASLEVGGEAVGGVAFELDGTGEEFGAGNVGGNSGVFLLDTGGVETVLHTFNGFIWG